MNTLLIINDAPYGNERCYNALRLALGLLKDDSDAAVNVFLMADAVGAANSGQKTPEGYYNVESMLKGVVQAAGNVYLCGTCMDARGIDEDAVIAGTKRSTMPELVSLTNAADKVLVF